MSNCSNCFNGCTEITSDKCVKYTGVDIPTLGIETGDTLASIEQKLFTFLISTLNGTGVIIDLTEINVCTLVQTYLPSSGDISIEDIAKALIKSACDLQTQLNLVKEDITTLNANYTIGCLSGVTTTSDTHDIVQATITKICEINTNLVALALELHTQYSRNGTELNNYISNYLATNNPVSNKYYTRMVPYTVVELYPTNNILTKFNNGAGQDEWEKIYFCNGQNGTPDKRGVVGVGVTDGGMGGLSMPSDTLPGGFNPNYLLSTRSGDNKTILTLPQIPGHTHIGTIDSVGNHTHNTQYGLTGGGTLYAETPYISDTLGGNAGLTTPGGSHTHTMSISSTGGGEAHSNVQVGLGCYYIMYIP